MIEAHSYRERTWLRYGYISDIEDLGIVAPGSDFHHPVRDNPKEKTNHEKETNNNGD